jgi:hypothetical protein
MPSNLAQELPEAVARDLLAQVLTISMDTQTDPQLRDNRIGEVTLKARRALAGMHEAYRGWDPEGLQEIFNAMSLESFYAFGPR